MTTRCSLSARGAASLSLALGLTAVSAACGGASATLVPASPSAASSAAPAALTIRYEEQAQFELALPDGRRIYLDVRDPGLLERQPQAGDILLVTNMAPHHSDPTFVESFPGRKQSAAAGTIETDGIRIVSIDSSDRNEPVDHEYAGNQIVLIEAAGLRIVACGDLDQAELDAEQTAALGAVDVALCPIAYAGNGPGDAGERARAVIIQMKARLIVPTHSSTETATAAIAAWKGSFVSGPAISVAPATLPAEPSIVFMGDLAPSFGSLLGLPQYVTSK